MKALDLFNSGKLPEAVEAAAAVLRSKPLDIDVRFVLAQLLCFQDEFERADRQFETFAAQAPQPVPGIALCRQLVRASKCRQEFFQHGRMPEFFSPPQPSVEELLRAWVHLRAGDTAAAVSLVQKSQEARPVSAGTCNGRPFSDFLDLDDFLAPVLEVLTPTGKYFWVPLSELRSVEFKPAERPMDFLWRPATLNIVNGPTCDACLPAVYRRPGESLSDGLRLGRETDWREIADGVCRGLGQKCFLVGEEDEAMLNIEHLTFTAGAALAGGSARGENSGPHE